MRKTYVPMEEHEEPPTRRDKRRREQAAHPVRSVVAAVLLDVVAVGCVATLLWLGAGTTVLTGPPLVMMLAFASGAVPAALSSFAISRAQASVVIAVALIRTLLLCAAFAAHLTVLPDYFFAWVVVFAGAHLAAVTALSLGVDAVAARIGSTLIWRLATIAAAVAAVALLDQVWRDNAVLIDLIIFSILLAVAAALLELGIRSFRASLRAD